MYLTSLSLTNFRLFTRLEKELPRQIVLLVGDNAQGKTSLLEAVYYMSTFTSFHTPSDRQLINFSILSETQVFSRMVAHFQRGGRMHSIEVRLVLDGNGMGSTRLRRIILVDNVQRTVHEALGQLNAVIFLPQMMGILEGGPEERRDYINTLIPQVFPAYAKILAEYNQVLTQRNALLKQLEERKGDQSQLDAWDDNLARLGADLIHYRIQVITEIEQLARRFHARLTHEKEILRLVYLPSYDPALNDNGQRSLLRGGQVEIDRQRIHQAQIQSGFCDRLKSLRREEIDRGVTTVGPHRDEIRLVANGIDLGEYGSRGQGRTALLALKMAEVAWLKQKTDEWPVLLLDETLAELDLQRRGDLLGALGECEQALLTTTDLNLFPSNFVDQCAVWRVTQGQIEV